MTTTSISYRTLNLLGSGDVSGISLRVRLRTFLEHKRCYGNFDNLRLSPLILLTRMRSKEVRSYNATIPSQDLLEKEGVDFDVTSVMDNLHCHMKTALATFKYSDKVEDRCSQPLYHIGPSKLTSATYNKQQTEAMEINRFSHKFLKQVGFSVSRTRGTLKGRRTIHRGSSSRKDDMYLTSATSESRFSTRQSLEISKPPDLGAEHCIVRTMLWVQTQEIMNVITSRPWAYEAQTNASCK
jgi:hypothetical protein